MPWYVVNGTVMHINMGRRKGPAPCVAPVGPDAVPPREHCCGISGYLCDWPVADDAEGLTCSAPLCDAHARQVRRDLHYCPAHHAEHLRAQPQLTLFTSLVGGDA